ncbi:hypothetical protein PROFUN_11937 [Planoprotostelium fungivorum]|uniref:F-box domain-containing protein n=1 Tax=Planoprotostelium fungivorum TaxID=1890364 RepID=A0A2P6N8T8_9EUKA|nr:hypothetical protein PROFUN_11937 [Planoprotostelium fungivorum]
MLLGLRSCAQYEPPLAKRDEKNRTFADDNPSRIPLLPSYTSFISADLSSNILQYFAAVTLPQSSTTSQDIAGVQCNTYCKVLPQNSIGVGVSVVKFASVNLEAPECRTKVSRLHYEKDGRSFKCFKDIRRGGGEEEAVSVLTGLDSLWRTSATPLSLDSSSFIRVCDDVATERVASFGLSSRLFGMSTHKFVIERSEQRRQGRSGGFSSIDNRYDYLHRKKDNSSDLVAHIVAHWRDMPSKDGNEKKIKILTEPIITETLRMKYNGCAVRWSRKFKKFFIDFNARTQTGPLRLPTDLWTDILSFLSLPDLCAPCFSSKALCEAARRVIDSSILESSNWWRHKKTLPVANIEIVKWWMSNIRGPTKGEVLEAARRDQLEVIDLMGWDNTQIRSSDHTHPFVQRKTSPWNWGDILTESIGRGSKRTIVACLNRGEHITDEQSARIFKRVGKEGNLEMLRWMHEGKEVEGLPLAPPGLRLGSYLFYLLARSCARRGHRHVILWLKEIGQLEGSGSGMYEAAGGAGRMDMITWMEENDISCTYISLADFVGSFELFQWALNNSQMVNNGTIYLRAINRGGCADVMRWCYENEQCPFTRDAYSFWVYHDNVEAYQLAIDHGYLTSNTIVNINSVGDYFPLIRWFHTKEMVINNLVTSAITADRLDILQWALENNYSFETDSIHQAKKVIVAGEPSFEEKLYEKMDIVEQMNEIVFDWLTKRQMDNQADLSTRE